MPIDSLSYSLGDYRLTVVAGNLNANATYTFRLLDTITDDALNPLGGEFDGYTFPTGNGSPGGQLAVAFISEADTVPPTASPPQINGGLVQRSKITSLSFQFSEDVSASGVGALRVRNDTTGVDVDLSGRCAVWEWDGYPHLGLVRGSAGR